ncbi:hypothetical protein FJT64_025638 [Amphibalanus amphitrite]|uniref:Uncharacterized protein n=1 Tax=Amphibalanus amphitrite TaxID=1232801 RepID=A0A6A4WHP8_AMPAM|nr:hypothetical protein FJT64_025638 [Amphibalanus amphitrite]
MVSCQPTVLTLSRLQSFRVTVGTCFPDLCTDVDVKTVLNDAPGFMSLPKVPDLADGITFRTDDVIGILVERQFWQDYTAVSALATVILFGTLAVLGTAVDLLYEDDAETAARPRGETAPAASKGEQTKLVERRPSSYSALEQREAPAKTGSQP